MSGNPKPKPLIVSQSEDDFLESDSHLVFKDSNTPKSKFTSLKNRFKQKQQLMNLCDKSLSFTDDSAEEDFLKQDSLIDGLNHGNNQDLGDQDNDHDDQILNIDYLRENSLFKQIGLRETHEGPKRSATPQLCRCIESSITLAGDLTKRDYELQKMLKEGILKGNLEGYAKAKEKFGASYFRGLAKVNLAALSITGLVKSSVLLCSKAEDFTIDSVKNIKMDFYNCAPYKPKSIKEPKKISFKISKIEVEIQSNYKKKQIKSQSTIYSSQQPVTPAVQPSNSNFIISQQSNSNLLSKRKKVLNLELHKVEELSLIVGDRLKLLCESGSQSALSLKDINLLEERITCCNSEIELHKQKFASLEREYEQKLSFKMAQLEEKMNEESSEIIPELLNPEQTFQVFLSKLTTI